MSDDIRNEARDREDDDTSGDHEVKEWSQHCSVNRCMVKVGLPFQETIKMFGTEKSLFDSKVQVWISFISSVISWRSLLQFSIALNSHFPLLPSRLTGGPVWHLWLWSSRRLCSSPLIVSHDRDSPLSSVRNVSHYPHHYIQVNHFKNLSSLCITFISVYPVYVLYNLYSVLFRTIQSNEYQNES